MVDKDVIIALLLRQNEQLTHQNQLLIEENQKLRERIARLEKNSSSSSKPSSSDIINPEPPAKNGQKHISSGYLVKCCMQKLSPALTLNSVHYFYFINLIGGEIMEKLLFSLLMV